MYKSGCSCTEVLCVLFVPHTGLNHFKMLWTLLSILIVGCFATAKKDHELLERVKKDLMKPYPVPTFPYWNTDYTADDVYDYNRQKCCLGNVYNGSLTSPYRCCGKDARDVSRQICCQGQVHDWESGTACCGSETYDTSSSVCCNNQAVEVHSDDLDHVDCCGDSVSDSRSQLCCYNSTTYKQIAVDKKDGDDQCCGPIPFNSNTEICCGSYNNGQYELSVVPKEGNKTLCCGKEVYDYTEEICCNDKLYQKTTTQTYCCGNDAIYDSQTELCCYNNDVNTVVKKANDNSICCGTKAYDYTKEICCNDTVTKNTKGNLQCCNNKVFDSNKYLCCYYFDENLIKKSDPKDNSCCGNITYNYRKEICCYQDDTQTVVKKEHPDDSLCCGKHTYEYGNGICCEGVPDGPNQPPIRPLIYYPGPCYTRSCCGGKSYDPSISFCCNSTIYKYTSGHACCGSKQIYNAKTEVCCYDYTQQNPTNVTVYKSDPAKTCCGTDYYKYAKMCCGNKVVDSGPNRECCKDKVYDYNEQICCGDNVLDKVNDNSQCCYSFITDEYNDCYEVVVPWFITYLQTVLGGGQYPPGPYLKKT